MVYLLLALLAFAIVEVMKGGKIREVEEGEKRKLWSLKVFIYFLSLVY